MTSNERLYVHFDQLCEFMIRELFDCKAKPLGWAICMGHIHRLPQYKYRSDINQLLTIETKGIEATVRALNGAIEGIGHLIVEAAPGVIVVAPGAKSQLAELPDSEPLIIVRIAPTTDSPPPQKTKQNKANKKDWYYANALFGGPDKAFYDFQEGNNLVKLAKKKIHDLAEFCDWRIEKKRPGLQTNIKDVMRDYERFKTPAVDVSTMAPAKADKAPTYRKIKLINKDDKNGQ